MKKDKMITQNCINKNNLYIAYVGSTKRNNIEYLSSMLDNGLEADQIIILHSSDECNNAVKKKINVDTELVNISNHSALENAILVHNYLLSKFGDDLINIKINITSIPRDLIVILLYIFENMHSCAVTVEYIPTDDYGSFEYMNYSEPQNIHFFGGAPKLNLPTRLIILPGHEPNAAATLVAYYRPSSIIIGYSPPDMSTAVANAQKNESAVERSINDSINFYSDEYTVKIDRINFSANNPLAMFSEFDKWLNSNEDCFNSVMTSFTTRLSSVGMYLIWRSRPHFQLVSTQGVPINPKSSISNETPLDKLSFKII